MLTATVAVVARRPLAAVQLLPVLFLSAYPLHNLPPDVHWTHAAQQVGSAAVDCHSHPVIAAARSPLCLLHRNGHSGCAEPARSGSEPRVCALSTPGLHGRPPHQLLSSSRRTRRAHTQSGVHPSRTHGASRALGPRLRPLLQQVDPEPTRSQLLDGIALRRQRAAGANPLFSFSPKQGLTAIAAVNPFGLIHWPTEESHLPGRHLAWLVLALTACACVLAGRRRTVPLPARSLAVVAAASLIGWLAAKYGMTFFAGGITKPTQDASLLYAYLFFLGRRVELWLLFLAALTAGVSVYLSRRDGRERAIARATIAGAVIILAAWWLPHARTHLDPRRNQLIARNLGVSGLITPDDIELASWMEHNLPPDKGLIALTSLPFKVRAYQVALPDRRFTSAAPLRQGIQLYFPGLRSRQGVQLR